MPPINFAISGLPECVALVRPLASKIVSAFAPYGIDLTLEDGIPLSSDPENMVDGWAQLAQALESRSNNSSPTNLVLTRIPPDHNGTIDGSLIDPSVRGVAAIYLDAYIYAPDGPARHPDLITQVCIHEIGHLLDLTHEDGMQVPPGRPAYSNAILPSSFRLRQPLPNAWAGAMAEAQAIGEPMQLPSPPVFNYPFNLACRNNLRSANTDPRWLPFHGPFRGNPEPGDIEDRSLKLKVRPHAEDASAIVGGGLYVTLELRNSGSFPIELPEHIAPEHSSVALTIEGADGRRVYRPSRIHCSNARRILLPKGQFLRSLAFLGQPHEPLFPQAGKYRCRFDLLDKHRPGTAPLATARLDVTVREDSSRHAAHLSQLLARKPKLAPLEISKSQKRSAIAWHIALVAARRVKSSEKRLQALRNCIDPKAPTAIRHRAARDIALVQLKKSANWRRVTKGLVQQFEGPEHEELHHAIRQTREGWIAHKERRSLGEP
jgi:hypothetical protein